MQAFFHTKAAQRRSIWAASHRPAAPACVMQLTVDTAAVTTLRQMVMRICGEGLQFMRIEACEHGARMKVWLCVGAALVARVMEAVMQSLPGAEFGRFTVRGGA
ncbi:hypothetical protein RugamoR64_18000 [Duganella rhizosphaerae]|uniref:hypothetical protein n=1 Tax=Duganella rhizosphaerae TaxID=2885763 RepID=UPI0030E76054